MTKTYKIHPSIGIARVGNSSDFFLAPETLDTPYFEISDDGDERPIASFKDKGYLKKQAARFRVFEYDNAGNPLREITADDAVIEWRVKLANRKAASFKTRSSELRNPGIPPEQLIIAPEFAPIAGRNRHLSAAKNGFFLSVPIFLGELRTDSKGRLVVLGGNGSAVSPSNSPLNDATDNPGWCDDVSDGPVSASITFPGQPPLEVEHKAWVIVGPPDYAPKIKGVTTLYDIAFQAAVSHNLQIRPNVAIATPSRPSFRHDVLPILQRAAALRWVHKPEVWDQVLTDWQRLSSLTDPAAVEARQRLLRFLMEVENLPRHNPRNFVFTAAQRTILVSWANGTFEDDYASTSPPMETFPERLDRLILEQALGGVFHPGVEASALIASPEIYASPFRLSHEPFNQKGVLRRLVAGSLTEGLAVPWQADYQACSAFWPAQRPTTVFLDPDNQALRDAWIDGVTTHQDMVENFHKLGIVKDTQNQHGVTVFVEAERNQNFPRPPNPPDSTDMDLR